MLLDGSTVAEVAEHFRMSPQTVRRYLALIEEGGLDALKKIGRGGRTSVLDRTALEWIAIALSGPATRYGFETEAWTNARLRKLIDMNYGVQYSRVYVWQIATNLGMGHRLSKSSR